MGYKDKTKTTPNDERKREKNTGNGNGVHAKTKADYWGNEEITSHHQRQENTFKNWNCNRIVLLNLS